MKTIVMDTQEIGLLFATVNELIDYGYFSIDDLTGPNVNEGKAVLYKLRSISKEPNYRFRYISNPSD